MQEISEAAVMTSAQPLPCSRPENAIECEMGLEKKPPETQYGKNVEGRKNLNMVSDSRSYVHVPVCMAHISTFQLI